MKKRILFLLVLLTTLAFTACGKENENKENDSKAAVTGEADVDATSSVSPTETPEATPTVEPVAEPTKAQEVAPTATTSPEPTAEATKKPVSTPTEAPTNQDGTAVLYLGEDSYEVTYDNEVLEVLSDATVEGMICFIAVDGSETEIDIMVYPDSEAQGLYDAWLLVLGTDNYSGMLGEEATANLFGREAKAFQFVTGYEEEFGFYNYEYFVDVEGVGAVGCSLYYFENTEFTSQEILDAVVSIKILG